MADRDVLNKLFWRAHSDTGQCRGTAPRNSTDRGEHRFGGCSPQISGGTRRKDDCEYSIRSTVFQLHSFACEMTARSSCYAAAVVGRNLKAGGVFCPLFSSLLLTTVLFLRGRILSRQSALLPCCPARLPKMQKRSSRRPSTSHHHISQTPIPQNGRIMLPAQSSALPVSANKPFFPFVLFRFPSSSSCMSSTHAEVMTPSSNGFVSGCYELFPVWRKWGQPRLSGALKSYQII